MTETGWLADYLISDAEGAKWTNHLVAKTAFAGAILGGVKLNALEVSAFRK